MGWLIMVGLALLALAGGLAYSAAQSVQAGARTPSNAPAVTQGSLKIDPGQVEMGNIKLGTTVNTSFKLQNVGDKPITITEKPYIEVVAGC